LKFPEYTPIHRDETPASVSAATYGEREMVRINSRIAMQTMKISQPDSPSR
jgi:hypothetical protein